MTLSTMHLPAGTKLLKIQWLVDVVGFTGSKLKKNNKMSLGFCEKKPDRIAFLAPNAGMARLVPMMVRDLFINKQNCEEGTRCLVVDCPLNQTTYESYRNSATWKRENIQGKANFNRLLQVLKNIECSLKSDIATINWNKNVVLCYSKPPIIIPKTPKSKGKDT